MSLPSMEKLIPPGKNSSTSLRHCSDVMCGEITFIGSLPLKTVSFQALKVSNDP